MTKTKNKKQLKVVKTKSNATKPKGTEIQTEHFGKLFYANAIEKNIIEKGVALMTAIKGIYGKFIPELATALNVYIAKFPKVLDDGKSGGLPAMKKYCWKLFDYSTVDKAGFKTKNESFERNVSRAIKLALLIHSKKCKFNINKKNEIKAVSNKVYPKVMIQNLNSKTLDQKVNTDTKSLQTCTIARMEELFSEQILGQKTDNKKLNANKGNTKDTKVKTLTIDMKVKEVLEFMQGINHISNLDKLKESKFKGSLKKDLVEIALVVQLLLAKNKTLTVNDTTHKVTTDNEILFSAKYQSQLDWAKVITAKGVALLSKYPMLPKAEDKKSATK